MNQQDALIQFIERSEATGLEIERLSNQPANDHFHTLGLMVSRGIIMVNDVLNLALSRPAPGKQPAGGPILPNELELLTGNLVTQIANITVLARVILQQNDSPVTRYAAQAVIAGVEALNWMNNADQRTDVFVRAQRDRLWERRNFLNRLRYQTSFQRTRTALVNALSIYLASLEEIIRRLGYEHGPHWNAEGPAGIFEHANMIPEAIHDHRRA